MFVVTGSSKGVGLEICRLLLDRSFSVIGLSRTPGPLNGCKDFKWCECDLSDADQVRHAAGKVRSSSSQRLDGVVFNAAFGYYGKTLEMEDEILKRIVRQNFTNQIILLKLLAPFMSNKSELFYVSTSASRIPAPMMAAYAATKAAFESFIQSVAMECGLRVHIARPAEINTEFSRTIGVPKEVETVQRKLSAKRVAKKTMSMFRTDRVYSNVGYRSHLIDLAVKLYPSILLKRSSSHIKDKQICWEEDST